MKINSIIPSCGINLVWTYPRCGDICNESCASCGQGCFRINNSSQNIFYSKNNMSAIIIWSIDTSVKPQINGFTWVYCNKIHSVGFRTIIRSKPGSRSSVVALSHRIVTGKQKSIMCGYINFFRSFCPNFEGKDKWNKERN